MRVAACEKPPRGGARRGGSAAVLWGERQPAAVGVTRSLIGGRVSSASEIGTLSAGARWLLGACEPFVRRSSSCYGGSVLCGPVPERLIGRSRLLFICSSRLNC